MAPRNPLTVFTGLGLVAVAVGCAAPVQSHLPDRGHRLDRETLDSFRRGVTTRAEAIERLGEPSRRAVSAEEGTTTLSWDYVHTDASGTLSILTVLKFGPDDKLLLKAVSQTNQNR